MLFCKFIFKHIDAHKSLPYNTTTDSRSLHFLLHILGSHLHHWDSSPLPMSLFWIIFLKISAVWGIFIQNQNFERSSIQVSFRTKQPFSPVCLLCIRLNNIKILLNHFIVSVLVWRSQMDWSHVVSELRNWVQKEADKCKKCVNMLACLLWMYGLGPGLIQESCTKKRTDEEVRKKAF